MTRKTELFYGTRPNVLHIQPELINQIFSEQLHIKINLSSSQNEIPHSIEDTTAARVSAAHFLKCVRSKDTELHSQEIKHYQITRNGKASTKSSDHNKKATQIPRKIWRRFARPNKGRRMHQRGADLHQFVAARKRRHIAPRHGGDHANRRHCRLFPPPKKSG